LYIQSFKTYIIIIIGIAQQSSVDGLGYTTLSYATGTETKYFVDNEAHIARPNAALEDTTSFTYKQHATIPHVEENHGGGDVTLYAQGIL
jgi:hypothetical protein